MNLGTVNLIATLASTAIGLICTAVSIALFPGSLDVLENFLRNGASSANGNAPSDIVVFVGILATLVSVMLFLVGCISFLGWCVKKFGSEHPYTGASLAVAGLVSVSLAVLVKGPWSLFFLLGLTCYLFWFAFVFIHTEKSADEVLKQMGSAGALLLFSYFALASFSGLGQSTGTSR